MEAVVNPHSSENNSIIFYVFWQQFSQLLCLFKLPLTRKNKWVWAKMSQMAFGQENKWCHESENACGDRGEGMLLLPNTSWSSCWTLLWASGWEPSRWRTQFIAAAVVSCPCMKKDSEIQKKQYIFKAVLNDFILILRGWAPEAAKTVCELNNKIWSHYTCGDKPISLPQSAPLFFDPSLI